MRRGPGLVQFVQIQASCRPAVIGRLPAVPAGYPGFEKIAGDRSKLRWRPPRLGSEPNACWKRCATGAAWTKHTTGADKLDRFRGSPRRGGGPVSDTIDRYCI